MRYKPSESFIQLFKSLGASYDELENIPKQPQPKDTKDIPLQSDSLDLINEFLTKTLKNSMCQLLQNRE